VILVPAVLAPTACAKATRVVLRIYDPAGEVKAEVGINDVVRSSARAFREPGGYAAVSFRLTARGVVKCNRLMRGLARRGARLRRAQRFVIEIDGEVRRIVVDYRAYPDGVDCAPGLRLTGLRLSLAQRLAKRIRDG